MPMQTQPTGNDELSIPSTDYPQGFTNGNFPAQVPLNQPNPPVNVGSPVR